MAANSPVDAATVLTNDITIKNLPPKYCSNSKSELKKYFLNKRKSGISSFIEILYVDETTATLRLENDEGM